MEIDGHEEITGEEIDWAVDTRDELDNDPTGELQEEFKKFYSINDRCDG